MDNLSPEQIKQMISMLQSMLPQNTISEEENEQTRAENNTSNIKTASPKKVNNKNKAFINKFDEMMESRLHQEDKAIDKILSVHSPTPRVRSFEPINVVCRVCGKKDSINPNILSESPSRYKCNNCARSPG